MVSIIIPYYKEPFLDRTIQSLKENAIGEIEIFPMDGTKGMRSAINEGLKVAKGDYIMKIDAHCAVCKGFDTMTRECKENWIMVPKRYALHEGRWVIDGSRLPIDYHYLSFPTNDLTYGYSFQVQSWPKKEGPEIDDTMSYQGSYWMANRKYFMDHVGLLNDSPDAYGTFAQEQAEEGLKYWLGGGEVKVNKKYWYAHLRKTTHHYSSFKFSRKFKKDDQLHKSNEWLTRHWMDNEEPNMIHPFSWLIEKFNPPTWPENWEEVWKHHSAN